MLRNHLQYRGAVHQDLYANCPTRMCQVMKRYYPQGRFGEDKCGSPIVYYPFGTIHARDIMCSARISEALTWVLYEQERVRVMCAQKSAIYGRQISQAVYILDLDGLGRRHIWPPGLEIFTNIARLCDQHTPEIMKIIYVINAPAIFPIIWKVVKPMLDENTSSKVFVYGHGKHLYEKDLLARIPADQLPKIYGGNLTDPDDDERCTNRITYGAEIPEKYHYENLPKSIQVMPPNEEIQSIHISAGKQLWIKFNVEKDNSLVFWYLHLQSNKWHDISFGVYKLSDEQLKNAENEVTSGGDQLSHQARMIFPYFKIFCHSVPEFSSVPVNKGLYVFRIDNSHSWITSKTFNFYYNVFDTVEDAENTFGSSAIKPIFDQFEQLS